MADLRRSFRVVGEGIDDVIVAYDAKDAAEKWGVRQADSWGCEDESTNDVTVYPVDGGAGQVFRVYAESVIQSSVLVRTIP